MTATLVDIFGPASQNAQLSRPADGRSFGIAGDTYFKNCTTPSSQDGTEVDAGWLNQMTGSMRALTRANGLKLNGVDPVILYDQLDDMALRSVEQLIQRCQLNVAVDSGSVNNVVATLPVTPAELVPGMRISVQMANAPTGPSMLVATGFAAFAIRRRAALALIGNEWAAGDWVDLKWTGAYWQLAGLTSSDVLRITKTLGAAQSFYVNTLLGQGSNANDGLTPGTSLADLQTALNKSALYNLNGFNVTIYVTGPTINTTVLLPGTAGSGSVIIKGNSQNPGQCLFQNAYGPCFIGGGPSSYIIDGVRVVSSGNGFQAGSGMAWTLQNIDYGPCTGAHISADNAPLMIAGNQTISGGAAAHVQAINAASIRVPSAAYPALNIIAAVAFSAGFVVANSLSATGLLYSSMTGAGNVTGPRFVVASNAVIGTYQGTGYYPGTTVPSAPYPSGGQYV